MALDDLFKQAAADDSKFPGSLITVQASIRTNRWGAGLSQPPAYDNLLLEQGASGTLAYRPEQIYPLKDYGLEFIPASFSGQVTSGPFQVDKAGKIVTYSYTIILSVYASTPTAPDSAVAKLTMPALKPAPTESLSNLFSTGTGLSAFFQGEELEASPPRWLEVQLDNYSLVKPPKPPRVVPSLVGMIFGGVAVDGGGTMIVGGVPGPVPPWGPLPAAFDPATRDLLIGIEVDELAKSISDPQASAAVRRTILSEMSRSIGLLAQSVSEADKAGGVVKAANPQSKGGG